MRTVEIDDAEDDRLSDYRHLSDAELRRATEQRGDIADGVFITEGKTAIRSLLRSNYPVRSVLVTPRRLEELATDLAGLDAPVYVADRQVLRDVVGFDLHRGAVAAAARLSMPAVGDLLATSTRVVVLEALNDHENLGVIFRNAAALGVDAALLCPRCADPLYRRTVRVSMGHVLHVPFSRVDPWPAALEQVRSGGFRIAALTPATGATPIDQAELPRVPRLALLLGSEGPGLSDAALAAADVLVRIPMAPGVDSLNVGSAAAIAFHLSRPVAGSGSQRASIGPGAPRRTYHSNP
jgi:tRNA G18 (ribose-2'-O)-methylase SpoU